MYVVHDTDIAEDDILSVVKYISDVLKAPIAANSLLDDIEKYEKLLAENPHIFPFVPDEYLRSRNIKYVMVKKYMMFYIIAEDEKIVHVIRFLYGSRDWKNILKENNGIKN